MKILLFGGSGQLGHEVLTRGRDLHFEVVSPVISEVDITARESVVHLAKVIKPDVIMNCAAYTAVDKAEQERDQAFALNCEGAHNVGVAARSIGCRVLHLSTDYVFGNGFSEPIGEEADTNPLNVYGASKLAGEQALLELVPEKALVVRTASLHGAKGTNFVHTMLQLMKERERLSVVCDQYMSPTWAGWLGEVLLDLCRVPCAGVVHASGAGVTTWYDFACAIYNLAKDTIGKSVLIEKVSAEAFARPARRPSYSALSCDKLARLLGRKPISWEQGLRRHLAELGMVMGEGL